MKLRKNIFLRWIAVFLWLGVIYYFSSQPNLKSELEPFWDFIFRKLSHMAEFFVLAFFLFSAYRAQGLSLKQVLVFSLLTALGGAFFDEWHQSFTTARTASIKDVGVDSLGILIFLGLKLFERKKNKEDRFLPDS